MSTTLTNTTLSRFGSADVARLLWQWWWLIAAFVLVYGQILLSVTREWWTNEDYTHGLFTPFALAYLIYERKHELSSISLRPSSLGFSVILASQVLLTVGYLGAEFFLQRVSLLVFLAGFILFLGGWRALSRSTFALTLIFLAIPLPAIVFNSFALPLQLLASSLAEAVLDLMQFSVYRDGNILQLPHGLALNVAEACSGIRSLVSLIALAALATMLSRFRIIHWWVRMLIIVSAVPVALAANAFRVSATGYLAYKFGEGAAEGFFHAFSGGVVFGIAFLTLLVAMHALQRIAVPPGDAAP